MIERDINSAVFLRGYVDPVPGPIHNGSTIYDTKAILVTDSQSCSIRLPVLFVGKSRIRRVDDQILYVSPRQITARIETCGMEQRSQVWKRIETCGMEQRSQVWKRIETWNGTEITGVEENRDMEWNRDHRCGRE